MIDPTRAAFVDHGLEQTYRMQNWRQMYWILLVGLSISLGFELMVMLINLNLGIGEALKPAVFYIRLSMLITTSLLIGLVVFHGKNILSLSLFNWACIIFVLAKMAIMFLLPRLDGVGSVNLIGGVLFIYLLFLLSWRAKLALAIIYSLGILIGWGLTPNSSPDIYYFLFWTLVANLVGAFVAYQRHTTERINMHQQMVLEQGLQEKHKLLQHNNAITDLLSHEIRTPLTTISLQADLLKRHADTSQRRIGEYIYDNSQALINMIESWLTTNQNHTSAIEFIPFSSKQLIEQVINDTKAHFPDTTFINQTKPLASIQFDERVLMLALKSLLSNAATHGHSGQGIRLSSYTSHSHIYFVVRDWGQGMRDFQLEELFARRSAKDVLPAQPGLGMGLHLLKRLINMADGDIKAYSKINIGTLIVLRIPR